jgi:hypothetical protein
LPGNSLAKSRNRDSFPHRSSGKEEKEMYAAGGEARRRPWVLGLIVLVHLLLGYAFFSMSAPAPGPAHLYAGVGGFAGGTGLVASPAAPPAKKREGFILSFDRTPLVGPSTFAPPATPAGRTRKVAPPFHPS